MTKLTTSQLESLCEVARDAAIEAGIYIQSQFDQEYEKLQKEGGDSLASQVVTLVDLKAQDIILNGLKDSVQSYGFGLLTEELTDDHSRETSEYFWCVDPMDGTLPFTERRSGYAVSIALISKAGDPVVGVVYVPDEQECYSAILGGPVSMNGQPLESVNSSREIHWYMDRSFQSEPYYSEVLKQINERFGQSNIHIHADYGGVRNAIGVMLSERGCYFKFPKKKKGCGSIWDYAATRLFFETAALHVTNANGNRLHLNDPGTTFMNDQGIIYATDTELGQWISQLSISMHQ